MITSKQETREKIHGISLNQIFNFFQKIQRDDNNMQTHFNSNNDHNIKEE